MPVDDARGRTLRFGGPLAALLALVSVGAAPQQPAPSRQQPPVFKVASDLVAIDLVATDSEGRFVADLRPEEIEILENGKPQPLQFLNLVALDGPAAAPAASATPTPPPLGDSLRAAPGGGLEMVVIVDLGSTPQEALPRVREAIAGMVTHELPAGSRLMLVLVDRAVQLRVPFTSDTAAFLAAVRDLPPTGAARRSLGELQAEVERVCGDGSAEALASAIGLARAWVDQTRLELATVIEGVGSVTRLLAPLPGRKHVVLYSAGYPTDPTSTAIDLVGGICTGQAALSGASARQGIHDRFPADRGEDVAEQLRRLFDEANRAQVSVYTVDSRGLLTDALPAGMQGVARAARRGQLQESMRLGVRAPQQLLSSLAEQTGGRAYLNTNDLARGMRAAARDARGYYLLGYAPAGERREGRFYPVQVKVDRPGLELRYRRGYLWLSEKQRRDRAIAAVFRQPGLFEGPELDAEAGVAGGKLRITAFVPTRALLFRDEAGEHRNELELYALLRDEKGRAAGDRYLLSKDLSLRLDDARYADLRGRDDVEIKNEVAAPKRGRYQLTLVVRHSGGRLAARSLEVVVP